MDGPPAALDFTPNVADGVADAAENAACAEPEPNLSPARATRGASAVGYAAQLQRTGTVLLRGQGGGNRRRRSTQPARPQRLFFYGHGAVSWPRRWTPLSAQHAAKEAQCEMLLTSAEFTGETSCGRGHARRQVRLISGRENLFATPPEEKKEIQSKTTIGRAVYKTRGSSPLPVLLCLS